MIRLSVIVVSYKVPHYLQLCLESVQRALTDIESEIIVVDNASGDTTAAMIRAHFPQVNLIINTENTGFSKANNQGVAVAQGEYVCILNPDTMVPETCFQEVLSFAERLKDLGGLGVRLIDGTGNFLPESKRNLMTPKVAVEKLFDFNQSYYASYLNETDTGLVSVLVGAFMLMKKSVYTQLGGFDEDYFMYGEDIDLSYRLEQAGYSNYYLGTTSVLHFKGESTVKDRTYCRRFYGAMRIYAKKHFYNNLLFEFLGKMGVQLVCLFKSDKIPKDKSPVLNSRQVWVSDRQNIPQELKQHLEVLKWRELKKLELEEQEKTRFTFDLEGSRVDTIIQMMQQLKNRENTFRIRPSNCNFSCGSDSAHASGEVQKWV